MIIEKLKITKIISDEEFDLMYPSGIQLLSERHWTPVCIAKIATDFLCHNNGLKILDIGSGVGKFCLVGASLKPSCEFYGVDLRNKFIKLSNSLKEKYRIKNVYFSNKNILGINLNNYNGVYFFNSFHENIDDTAIIDQESRLSGELYKGYVRYLFSQLQEMPNGSRLATYHTPDFYVPGCYRLVERYSGNKLKLYIKSNYNQAFHYTLQENIMSKHILRNAI